MDAHHNITFAAPSVSYTDSTRPSEGGGTSVLIMLTRSSMAVYMYVTFDYYLIGVFGDTTWRCSHVFIFTALLFQCLSIVVWPKCISDTIHQWNEVALETWDWVQVGIRNKTFIVPSPNNNNNHIVRVCRNNEAL